MGGRRKKPFSAASHTLSPMNFFSRLCRMLPLNTTTMFAGSSESSSMWRRHSGLMSEACFSWSNRSLWLTGFELEGRVRVAL